MYAKWIPNINFENTIVNLSTQVNKMTRYQVAREETSINLTTLVNRSIQDFLLNLLRDL